ncbi:glycosyltransferase [Halolactibacillus sp. JCM 19043]|uniref:glycosyltransferase family 2 protein n=1 Tax=Halolactibacillus sp. JCM 19043 TaxID=1460638 RepID=UPI0026F4609B|nr:glycosyltransferase [Halolactibacillus sp. JCM 19043]
MKLLSIIIPCYNSESYMHYAIESLVVGGEDVEILLINDGSTDETEAIATHYAAKYPGSLRLSIKQTADMVRRLTPVLNMRRVFILKSSIAMTGSILGLTLNYLTH